MAYATIQPPYTLDFKNMSKTELEGYRRWFLAVIPERVTQLSQAVRAATSVSGWSPDYTPESLDTLGEWFAEQVETRSMTDDEARDLSSRSPYPIEISGKELTNRTFSLAMDIGLYLSQVLMRSQSPLEWEQPLGDKKFADYGQLVIKGVGPVPLNPIRVVVNLAYGIERGKETGRGLRQIHDVWLSLLSKRH